MEKLNKENAKTALRIRNIQHPEWGTKGFNYNAQPLGGGKYISIVSVGPNSYILPDDEFHLWEVISDNHFR